MSQVGQKSASESRPNFSFQILTKLLLPNFDQTSASKTWPNFCLQILTKLLAQNVDQSLTAKSRPNFTFKNLTKLQTWGILSIGARFFSSIFGTHYSDSWCSISFEACLIDFWSIEFISTLCTEGVRWKPTFCTLFSKEFKCLLFFVEGKILLSVEVMVEKWIKREL